MDRWQRQREEMVDLIRDEMIATRCYTGLDALSPRVEQVIRQVPRHLFVPAWNRYMAYANTPLPIGHGQTISQPYIVALMSELLSLSADDAVLEIGTGCGYQTAVLARLAREVCTLEVVAELLVEARERLREQGFRNIDARLGSGWLGWPEARDFDAIMVTAAAAEVPQALLGQLKEGGRMVIPVGEEGAPQELLLIEKGAHGLRQRPVLPVAFVPLVDTG